MKWTESASHTDTHTGDRTLIWRCSGTVIACMSRQVSLSGDELIVVYSYTLYNVLANVAEQLSIPVPMW
ncbi:unnamed protein product [Arctogadus glacialis]